MSKNSSKTPAPVSAAVQAELDKSQGIDVKNNRLRMRFLYQGIMCPEVLRGIKLDVKGVRYARRKRESILHEIAVGTFDYREHFPDSPRADRFSSKKIEQRTVDQGVELWLASKEVRMAKSTFRNYKNKSKRLVAKFGKRLIPTVSKAEMEAYQAALVKSGLAPKTVNDIFTIARGVWRDAHIDGIIERNIMEAIKNYELPKESDNAFPFTQEELERIGATSTSYQSEQNMVMFDCWVGLSATELIALAWEDIDLERWTARVRRAYVDSEWKVPKENYRERTVEIIHPAREWLARQLAISAALPPIDIEVRQRDNITAKSESIRPIFINTRTGRHFSSEKQANKTFLKTHLRKAKVAYRALNQCKHTFASQMLSNYISKDWIINQLGHANYDMLYRHYAQFIPDDTPLLADIVTTQLGLDGATFDAKVVPLVSQNPLKVVK